MMVISALALFTASFAQAGYVPGASLRLYQTVPSVANLPTLVAGQTPNIDRLISKIEVNEGEFGMADHFYVEVTGELQVTTGGTVTFRLTSDDGSALLIDGKEIAENDGIHAAGAVEGKADLAVGWHPFKVRYFEGEGQESLKLEWKPAGATSYSVIDDTVMRTPKGETRVVSPGVKAVKFVGGAIRPGNGMPLEGPNPGVKVQTIRPDWFRPQVGGMAFLPDKRLVISTFQPNQGGQFLPKLHDGKLWILDGVLTGDPKNVKIVEAAHDLQEPLGMLARGNDIFVSERTKVERFRDTDGDGVFDQRQTVASGWTADNYHHFTFGLVESGGWMYASLSTSITGDAPGINGPNPLHRGSVFRFQPEKYDPAHPEANIEWLTGGHRTPNGLVVGPGGQVFVGENQGSWQPANKLNPVYPGHFYGHYNNTTYKNREYPNGGLPSANYLQPLSAPAIYIPQNECGNSPTQSLVMPNGRYAGQLVMGDIKYGGLSRVFLEQVNGQWQGGIVHWTQGFESGIHRMVWGPDGNLYLGGMGASATWGWTDPKTGHETTFGLQRAHFSDVKTFEIHRIHATEGGFVVHFTLPARSKELVDPTKYIVKQWTYAPTVNYGGDKYEKENLRVSRAIPAPDGRSVRLIVPGLRTNRVVYLNLAVKSTAGKDLYSSEAWYTLNSIPVAKPVVPRILVYSRTTGFRHDSIPDGIAAIRKLGKENGYAVDASEDSSVFTKANLAKYKAVVFLSTTGDAVAAPNRPALEAFIRNGGGWLGIHSASDTMYDWPFYGDLVGAYFESHPRIQEAEVKIEDRTHFTTWFLPPVWRRTDEWYNFRSNPRQKLHVLASLDESSYEGGTMKGDHPVMWCHEVGKGRAWYTELGHPKEAYTEPLYLATLNRGIQWVLGAR